MSFSHRIYPLSTDNKTWKDIKEIKNLKDPLTEEIILEYNHEEDLFYLSLKDWDGEAQKDIMLYPSDLSRLCKLFYTAQKECENAGWYK